MTETLRIVANEAPATVGLLAPEHLRSLVHRLEKLEEERKDLAVSIRDIMQEAASSGFNSKVIRQLLKARKADAVTRELEETLLDTYQRALRD